MCSQYNLESLPALSAFLSDILSCSSERIEVRESYYQVRCLYNQGRHDLAGRLSSESASGPPPKMKRLLQEGATTTTTGALSPHRR